MNDLVEAIGFGLLAGLAGTVALTLSETLEMRLTGREASMVPGQVGAKLLGRDPDQEPNLGRLSTIVHWSHGISLGAVRGLLWLAGLGPVAATAVHYAAVWGGDALLYRSLGISPWPWQWKGGELARDLFHKGVYAVVTGVVFELLA